MYGEDDWFCETDSEYRTTSLLSNVEMPDKKLHYGTLGKLIRVQQEVTIHIPGMPAEEFIDIPLPPGDDFEEAPCNQNQNSPENLDEKTGTNTEAVGNGDSTLDVIQ